MEKRGGERDKPRFHIHARSMIWLSKSVTEAMYHTALYLFVCLFVCVFVRVHLVVWAAFCRGLLVCPLFGNREQGGKTRENERNGCKGRRKEMAGEGRSQGEEDAGEGDDGRWRRRMSEERSFHFSVDG